MTPHEFIAKWKGVAFESVFVDSFEWLQQHAFSGLIRCGVCLAWLAKTMDFARIGE